MSLLSLLSRRATSATDLKDEATAFWKQGFIVVRGIFKPEEMAVLKEIIAQHAGMRAHAARALERSAGATRPSFETV